MSSTYCGFMATHSQEIEDTLRSYAAIWKSGDLEKILAAYHDDIELHYMGTSPLAGHHVGKEKAFNALGLASIRAERRLLDVEDVMIGTSFGALVTREEVGNPPREVRRVLLYRVQDAKLRECWLYDEDQRFIDELWSKET